MLSVETKLECHDGRLACMEIEWLNIRQLAKADEELVAQRLPQRFGRAQKFLHEDDCLRCIGAGLLMLRLGLRAEADIAYGAYGKPEVAYLQPFNISHSGEYVVCARCDSAVGVDVERPRVLAMKVAERVFLADELNWMRECDSEQRFCQLWTCKEAVMKLFGEGLHMPPESFSVMELINGKITCINGTTISAHFETCDGHTLCAVCAENPLEPALGTTVPKAR